MPTTSTSFSSGHDAKRARHMLTAASFSSSSSRLRMDGCEHTHHCYNAHSRGDMMSRMTGCRMQAPAPFRIKMPPNLLVWLQTSPRTRALLPRQNL